MSKADQNILAAAYWLVGVNAAFNARGFPSWVDRTAFFRHRETALQVVRGGTFNGAGALYDLLGYVEKLSVHLTPPMRFRG